MERQEDRDVLVGDQEKAHQAVELAEGHHGNLVEGHRVVDLADTAGTGVVLVDVSVADAIAVDVVAEVHTEYVEQPAALEQEFGYAELFVAEDQKVVQEPEAVVGPGRPALFLPTKLLD